MRIRINLTFEYIWIYLEEMLSKCPFLLSMNICWFNENETIIWVHFVIVRVKISLRISTNEGALHINMLVIIKVKHIESTNRFFIYSLVVNLLIIKSGNLDHIRPFTHFLYFFWIFRGTNCCCNPNSIISPGIQICDDASMSFTLINLSELFNSTDLYTYAILKNVNYSYLTKWKLLIFLMFPL